MPQLARLIDGLTIRRHVPQIEVAAADNATALVLRVLITPSEDDVAALLAFGEAFGFVMYLQPGDARTLRPLTDNAPALYYELPRQTCGCIFSPLILCRFMRVSTKP